MPTCQSCQKEWSWKFSFGRLLRMKRDMPCPHCGQIQFISTKSRRKMSYMSLIPILPLFFTSRFDLPVYIFFLTSVLIFLIVMAIVPFFLQLSDKEETVF